jgi:hypothetical protein
LRFSLDARLRRKQQGRLKYPPAASIMREARSSQIPVEKRAADYLQAAAMTAPLLGIGAQETPAGDTYNAACGELTVLLRSSEGGRLWNRPLTLTANSKTYHLRLEPAANAVWAPNYFTTFEVESQVKEKLIRRKTFIKVLAVHLLESESSIHPKSSRRPEELLQRLRRRWIFTEAMPRLRFVALPSNRRQVLKGKFVLWKPISPPRSATTSRRPICFL